MADADPIRAALERLVSAYDQCKGEYEELWPEFLDEPFAAARAALAAPKPPSSTHVEGEVAERLKTSYAWAVLNAEAFIEASGIRPSYDDAMNEGHRYMTQYSEDGLHCSLVITRVQVLYTLQDGKGGVRVQELAAAEEVQDD